MSLEPKGLPLSILFAGGGTGGHLYPALAIASRLRELHPDARILFVGTHRLEAKKVPEAGFPISFITVRGLAGGRSFSGMLRKIYAALLLVSGLPIWQSLSILRRFRPEVVVGTGGYVCGPVIFAARLLKIPSMSVEQNVRPGVTTRALARLVDIAALTCEESLSTYPMPHGFASVPGRPKLVVTGNPVRADLLRATREDGLAVFDLSPERITLLVYGGSLGSPAINRIFLEALETLADEHWFRSSVQILHITGQARPGSEQVELGERARNARRGGLRYQAFTYLDNIPLALAAADLVICRGGGTTIAELTVCGLPAIIIPWAGAANNEQYYNSRPLAAAGGAVIIQEDELTPGRLLSDLKPLLQNPPRLEEMAQAGRSLARPNATDDIIRLIEELSANQGKK
jgi:UDP-N-acetylglucosamine--N-acetylmuramyl-(pentapeptide) pyrophosphoryl-undecaprenol N-acetylglucosamine transferase